MRRLVLALLVGFLGGFATLYFLSPEFDTDEHRGAPIRDIERVPQVSMSAAEAHREDSFASIKTIEDVLALPTDFSQTAALYVIAGREDIFGVQDLISDAARISESGDRLAALRILLMRLTELDPHVALDTARRSQLGDNASFEKIVWATWGRLDLEAALSVAKDGTRIEKNNAAQSLYASIRGFDTDAYDRIQSVLGISLDRNSRAQRIYAMASDSPAAAIEFIESRGNAVQQQEEVRWLAYHLSKSNPAQPPDLSGLFNSAGNRRAFEQSMASYGATANPEAVLDRFVEAPRNPQNQALAAGALQTLAQQDPERAIAYLEKIPDAQIRQQFASVIAQGLATSDPDRALEWARNSIASGDQSLVLPTIIAQIAQSDPDRAMAEAQTIPTAGGRAQAVQMAISMSMQADPEKAIGLIALVEEPGTKRRLIAQAAQIWGQTDYDGALQWIGTLDEQGQNSAVQGLAQQLVHNDVDQAIALLQQFPAANSSNVSMQIATSIAQTRSVESAMSYIAQFEGSPGYSRMQMSVLSVMAQSDPEQAMRSAHQVQDARQRDQLVASIAARKAQENPQLALQWTESIDSSAQRQMAIQQVVSTWNLRSPQDALTWVRSLPQGGVRDSAVMAIAVGGNQSSAEALALIDTISDEAIRKQASLTLVHGLMGSDVAEARRLLSTLDLSDQERLQYEQMLDVVSIEAGYQLR